MQLLPIERVTTHTLLGIRFWDRLTGQVVPDGLEVKAQRIKARSQRLGKPVLGRVTPSGVIAFFGLFPGERPVDPDQSPWEPESSKEDVVVDLVDRSDRFLPMSFVVQAPLKGVFRGQGEGLASDTRLFRPEAIAAEVPGVQLWSAPTRPIPPGMAVIRAQIVRGDGGDAPPADSALVRVSVAAPAAGFDHYGLADDRGMVLLPIPYPPIPDPATPETPYPPLGQQTFPLTLRIYHAPNLGPLPGSDRPDLEVVLSQPLGNIAIHRTEAGGLEFREDMPITLQYGRSLILGTALSSSSPDAESVLRIQPT